MKTSALIVAAVVGFTGACRTTSSSQLNEATSKEMEPLYTQLDGKRFTLKLEGADKVSCSELDTKEEINSSNFDFFNYCKEIVLDLSEDTLKLVYVDGKTRADKIRWAIQGESLRISKVWPRGQSGTSYDSYQIQDGTLSKEDQKFVAETVSDAERLVKLVGDSFWIRDYQNNPWTSDLVLDNGSLIKIDISETPVQYNIYHDRRVLVFGSFTQGGKFALKEWRDLGDAKNSDPLAPGTTPVAPPQPSPAPRSIVGDEVYCGNVSYDPKTLDFSMKADNGDDYLIASNSKIRPALGYGCYSGETLGSGSHGEVIEIFFRVR